MSSGLINQIASQLAGLDKCIEMVQSSSTGFGRASCPHARVLRDAEHVLKAINAKAAIVGGLAVIHHGYLRYTRDVDIVLPAGSVADFLRIVELLKENWSDRNTIRSHLTRVHSGFVAEFDRLVSRAASETAKDRHR